MTDISIIIPTMNRATLLAGTLESVGRVVRRGAAAEIIVVDNGSTDKTRDAFNAVSEKYRGLGWRYFFEPTPGLLSGRHKGAAESHGKVLCYLDDDVLLAPDWLDAVEDGFHDPAVTLVGGPSRPSYQGEPPDWLAGVWRTGEEGRWCESLSLIDLGSSIKLIEASYVFGLNFSIRKTAFQDCGGFHPDCVPKPLQRYQGDGETGLALKLKEKGARTLYHPGATVTHVIPAQRLTPKAFAERAFYQGVCDSYTQIRRERRVRVAPQPKWKGRVRPLKRRIEKLLSRGATDEIGSAIGDAYFAGVQFHRSQVQDDSKLLSWVLKDNYFDYNLPEGWKRYRM